MPEPWTCPRCARVFRRRGQTHSCHVAHDGEAITAGRAGNLVRLYHALERQVRTWEGVELVVSRKYVLFRTTRVFADLVFMRDALRLALLLDRTVRDPLFFKTGAMSAHRIAHVARVRTVAELRRVIPFLREAHRHALIDLPARRARAGAPHPTAAAIPAAAPPPARPAGRRRAARA